MDFELTKEQELLRDTLQRFVAQEYAFEARRGFQRSADGFGRAVWAKLAEMGLLALLVPEAHGGMGAGGVEVLLAMNAIGRGLLLEPYLPSAVLATSLVSALGSPAQQEALLPALAAGERIAVPAHGEAGARYDLERVATTARRAGEGWVLSGEKAVVLHAEAADVLLVSARTSGEAADPAGVSLFLVDRGAPGLSLRAYPTLDGQRAAHVTLRDVRVPGSALLGPEGGALEVIGAAWDVGTAALCAEAVGALQALLDRTIEYAKTRKQFGVPIGKFQALQHRMADMLVQVEQARSMSYLAAVRAWDPDPATRRRAISAAKVVIGQACRRVGQEAIQLHGGIGMTDELDVTHYFRRLVVIELSLGDTEHHLERFVRTPAPEARG
jgi:alkylation response protein AidB-like acyl-CoA dehydrogenase